MVAYAIAVDLGGTQLRAALVDSAGRILERADVLTDATAGPEIIIEQIDRLVKSIAAKAGDKAIRGVGVSSPGPLDTQKGIALGFSAPVCVLLGVVTGVAGGIMRDVLTGEVPLVFRREIHLYATAALSGSALCVVLESASLGETLATIAGAALVLGLRLAGIYWKISLPLFETRS